MMLLPRALDLTRAFATAAWRRGHALTVSRKDRPRGLHLQIRGHRYQVTIAEELDQELVEPDPKDRRYAWQRVTQQYRPVPNRSAAGRAPASDDRRWRWADSGRARAENMLADAISEAERRADADDEARQAWQRQHEEWLAAEKRREAAELALWQAAMAEARVRAVGEHRGTTFDAALADWC
jgi:hypothetical protein